MEDNLPEAVWRTLLRATSASRRLASCSEAQFSSRQIHEVVRFNTSIEEGERQGAESGRQGVHVQGTRSATAHRRTQGATFPQSRRTVEGSPGPSCFRMLPPHGGSQQQQAWQQQEEFLTRALRPLISTLYAITISCRATLEAERQAPLGNCV